MACRSFPGPRHPPAPPIPPSSIGEAIFLIAAAARPARAPAAPRGGHEASSDADGEGPRAGDGRVPWSL